MDPELGNPEWIDSARSFVTNLSSEDTSDVLRLLAPNVTLRVLGHNALSGTFSGREAVARHLDSLINQTGGRVDPLEFDDWMLGLSHVSVLVDVNAEVAGAEERLRTLLLMHFNLDNLIDESTVFFADPDVADRLYGQFLRDDRSQPQS